MREAFAHDAVLLMEPDADVQAPGAAITVALCGHWEHPPPCPLSPHHSRVERRDDEVHVRVLFATEPDSADDVRRRIDESLRKGMLLDEDGTLTQWRLRASGPGVVAAEETAHAQRLIDT